MLAIGPLALCSACQADGAYTLTGKKENKLRITSKGQVTIPQDVREETGLLPHTEVRFIVEDGAVRIVKAEAGPRDTRGRIAIRHLRGRAGDVTMSTEEIMALTRGDG